MGPTAFGLAESLAALPPRKADAHKHDARVLVIAGSSEYLGAALLCARGALRGGAGYVQLALPQPLSLAAMAALPEAVVAGLPGLASLGPEHTEALLSLASKSGAVAIGPGLGRREGTQALVRELWRRLPQAAVFDADALAALKAGDAAGGLRILTPHEGELKVLLGEGALSDGREAAAWALSELFNAVALLKGPGSLSAEPGGRLSRNESGGPMLATAGTGDVLTGLVAALLAQGCTPFDAASLGAWLHGRAGELWSVRNGGRGLLASDLADHLPWALAEAGA